MNIFKVLASGKNPMYEVQMTSVLAPTLDETAEVWYTDIR